MPALSPSDPVTLSTVCNLSVTQYPSRKMLFRELGALNELRRARSAETELEEGLDKVSFVFFF